MILGAAKSGTTSLAKYLSVHPDIALLPNKEIHYFDWRYDHTYQWYEDQFKSHKKYMVDATPYYLFHPLIPSRVKAYNPDCKFIILLRDPADRAVSHYFHNMKIKNMKDRELSHWREFLPLDEELPIKDAFRMEEERIKDQYELVQENAEDKTYHNHILQHYSYKARGHYAEQLKRWFKIFPKENFLIVDFYDLTNTPDNVLKKVYAFLNIKVVMPHKFDNFNQGSYAINKDVQDVINELRVYYAPYDHDLFDLTQIRFEWMKN